IAGSLFFSTHVLSLWDRLPYHYSFLPMYCPPRRTDCWIIILFYPRIVRRGGQIAESLFFSTHVLSAAAEGLIHHYSFPPAYDCHF
ncbi:MAG: hypothetical protein ABI760_17235, partial [Ferruginibacter sp.]